MGPGGLDGPNRQVVAVRQFTWAGFSWQVNDVIHVPTNVARQMIEAGNAIDNPVWSTAATNYPWVLTYFQQPQQP